MLIYCHYKKSTFYFIFIGRQNVHYRVFGIDLYYTDQWFLVKIAVGNAED